MAQSDTGEIVITVIDASSKNAISNARTFLIGPTTASSLTTGAGVIKYTDVPTGIYRVRVSKQGYDSGLSSEFDVLGGRSVAVNVELALSTGGLKVIGTVTARSNVQIQSNDISDSSAVRRLSDSLTDALNKLAGVSITQDSNDPNAAVTVSLRGHDESQTAITLDGIPLAAAGSAANLRQIGTDLFSGSSASFGASAGSLGGGVNFRTLQPTQAMQEKISGTYGTFDRANYSVATTGSIGSLGIAAQHTWRGSNSPLTFQQFEDQSGLTYSHEGESINLGDFLKLRYKLGDNRTSISATALSNNNDIHSLCTQFVTVTPCGSGPNNFNFGRYAFGYTTVQSLVGQVATTFSAYANSSIQNSDFLDRFVDGIPAPSDSTTSTTTRGVAFTTSIAEGHHTLTLSGSTYASIMSSIPKAGSIFEVPFTNDVSSTSFQFADSIKSSDKITLSPNLSLAQTSGGVGNSVLGGFSFTWRPQQYDTFTSSVSFGSSQPGSSINRSFSDPLSSRMNCGAQSAIVSGPGDGSGPQSAFNLDQSWTHQFRSGSAFTLNGYSQVQTGQLIQALIAEPISSTYFPPGYVPAIDAQFHQSTVCGAAGPNPTIFVSEPVGGTRRLYQGVDASGRFGLGRYVVALPTYSINIAKLTAAGPRLLDGPSTSILGSQLPGRPIHRGGITLDGLLPRSKTELLFNAQYTGPNNFQNLGSYATVSAGISHDFGPGRVTLFENNMFNTYAGTYFSTDLYARPLPLSSGSVLTSAAFPLTPRTISVSYSVNVGGPRVGAALAAQLARGGGQTPAQNPQGANQIRFVPVPPPAGTDPLSLATTRASCDADAQAAAKPFMDELRGYITAYEKKTTPLPTFSFIDVVPHVASLDPSVPYFLELKLKFSQGGAPGAQGAAAPAGGNLRGGEGGGAVIVSSTPDRQITPEERAKFLAANPQFRAYRGLLGCSYLTGLTTDQAKAKGIVMPPGARSFLYVPGIGLVGLRPPELPQGGGSLRGAPAGGQSGSGAAPPGKP